MADTPRGMTALAAAEYRAETESPAPDRGADEVVVIEPRRGSGPLSAFGGGFLGELVRHRELFAFLVWRDVTVRYKMAALGVLWALAVPLGSTLIYGVVGILLDFGPKVGSPYLLYMAAGMTPWTFLLKSVNDGGQSLINNRVLLTKVYLPRLYIPAAACGTALVDLAIALAAALAFGLVFWARGEWSPGPGLLAVVPMLGLTFALGVGTAVLLSGLTVLYRDLRFLIPFFTQFGLWLSGVVYPTSVLGEWEWVLAFNPYAGVVSGWRSAVCGTPWQPWLIFGAACWVPVLLWAGVWYFRRVERRFADIA